MIKELLENERPYEKCVRMGAAALSDAELLAVLLRTGTKGTNAIDLARQILDKSMGHEGLLNIHQLSLEKLKKIKGIGKVKAIQIVCLSELAKRLSKAEACSGLIMNHPATIANYFMEEMRHEKQELLKLLMLNTKSKVLGETCISKGTVNSSLISPREIFMEALAKEAVSIVLVHNHPSGDPTPSEADKTITVQIKNAGEMIGIHLLDHIIIGNNCYTSFAEKHLL